MFDQPKTKPRIRTSSSERKKLLSCSHRSIWDLPRGRQTDAKKKAKK